MRRLCCRLSVLALFFTSSIVLTPGSHAQDSTRSDKTVTKEEALNLALRYTGFGRIQDTSKMVAEDMVKKVVVTDDQTPGLNKQINGRELWQVTFASVKLEIPGTIPSVLTKQKLKTFDVIIDPETGQLLRIRSRYSGDMSAMPKSLSEPQQAERRGQLLAEYHGFAPGPQPTDFYEALCKKGPSDWIHTKQISAMLVMYTDPLVHSPTPTWVITGSGISAFNLHGTNFVGWICTVDATKGEGIGCNAIE